jgi:heat shock protein HslJ
MRIARLLATAAAATSMAGCGSTAAAADPLTGTTWRLIGIDSMAPNEQPSTTIDDPAKYTLTFNDSGQASFQLDCNRGTGTWKAEAAAPDSGSLTFGPIGMTKMLCPQPTVDTKVAAALGQVRSYLIADGRLHLSMLADSGIMNWEPQTS